MSEVLNDDNARILAKLVKYGVSENNKNDDDRGITHMSNLRAFSEATMLMEEQKHLRSYIHKLIGRRILHDAPTEREVIRYINNCTADTVSGFADSRNLMHTIKSLSLYFSEDHGYFYPSAVSHNDIRSCYSNFSALQSLPKHIRKEMRKMKWFEVPVSVRIKRDLPKLIGMMLNVEIQTMDDSEYNKLKTYVEGIRYSHIAETGDTTNSLIRKKWDDTGYVVYSGIFALWSFCYSGHWENARELNRNLNRCRSRRNEYLRNHESPKIFDKNKIVENLFRFAPRTWETNPNVPSVCKYFAKSKFPLGSLSAIEVEFVMDASSPLLHGSGDLEPCGECDGCTSCDEHGEPNGECEDPIQRGGCSAESFLQNPMIVWTTDGSVASTRPNQVRHPVYQEVRCVQNIKDPSNLKALCDFMKLNKFEVNRSCGLHVHIDTRDLTSRVYSRKATRAQEAVKNWVQYCVPFSRFEGSFCSVYSGSRWDRYRAVNTTARDKHNTLEFRLGSGSTNFDKIWNWTQLCHFLVRAKSKIETIHDFLESEASPELKAFVIARIIRFYKGHCEGRLPVDPNNNRTYPTVYRTPDHEANKIPDDIHKIVKIWGSVGVDELGG